MKTIELHTDDFLLLLDEEGRNIRAEARGKTKRFWHPLFYPVPRSVSVGELLLANSFHAGEVRYALHFDVKDAVLTVYKPPKELSIMKWIDELRDRAREDVRREFEAIDAEAEQSAPAEQ